MTSCPEKHELSTVVLNARTILMVGPSNDSELFSGTNKGDKTTGPLASIPQIQNADKTREIRNVVRAPIS